VKSDQKPLLGELTTEEFRLRLACLIDPHEKIASDQRAIIKDLAIQFAAELPALFGETLDRVTMWDRIGSGLQSAFAKSAGADYEFFVNDVLDHIKASPSQASANENIEVVLSTLDGWSISDRQAWLSYFHTHLIPVLVRARSAWANKKKSSKKSAHVSEGGK